MRALYLILGILVGAMSMSRYSTWLIEALVESQMDEVLAQKLVGFYDGYQRGYLRARAKYQYQILQCVEELKRAGYKEVQ
jgi:hypothetical protein